MNNIASEENGILTVKTEEGVYYYTIIAIFPVEENKYIALLPVNENGKIPDESKPLLCHFFESEDGEVNISQVDVEKEKDEINKAVKIYNKLIADYCAELTSKVHK